MATKTKTLSKSVPRKVIEADGDISELSRVEKGEKGDKAGKEAKPKPDGLPRPEGLGKEAERGIIADKACPECGYAVTRQRTNNKNYHVCTGNYDSPPLCYWHRELDADGKEIAAPSAAENW